MENRPGFAFVGTIVIMLLVFFLALLGLNSLYEKYTKFVIFFILVASFLLSTVAIVNFVMCKKMNDDSKFRIPDDLQQRLTSQHYNIAAVESLSMLSRQSGYVLITGDFNIDGLDEGICCLRLTHPLNRYLEAKDPPVSILVLRNISSITLSGKMAFVRGETIRIVCIEKTIRWQEETRSLVICPISIY